jgi:hypothetical protein
VSYSAFVRFRELRHGGDRPFTLGFHPRLTLLTGLGDEGRRWMADLLQRALRGDLGDLGGTVDVHGVERQLTDALVAELALPADVDVLVRPVDLPGARSIVPENAARDSTLDDDGGDDLPDLRALANELSQARHALARATENRAHTEQLLDGSRHALAPLVADVAEADTRLAAARRRRDDAAARLEAAITSVPRDDDRHRTAAERARLQEQRATLEARRQQIMEAIDRLVADDVDPSAIAAALTARMQWRPTEPRPVQEALDLADELDGVDAELGALPEPLAAPPSLLADAERELADACAELSSAEAALAERQVAPDDVARIDALHAEVLDAEDRAERRFASPLAKKRVKDALAAENAFLGGIGFTSYSDYLLSTATLIVDPAAPKRVGDARRRLAVAEAVWDELTGREVRAQREQLEERQVTLLRHARDLLGGLPDGNSADVSAALRDVRTGDDVPDDRQLAAALFDAGIDVADDGPIATAERFLAVGDERHAQRAALQAELATVVDDLDVVNAALASLPSTVNDAGDDVDAALDEARADLRRAQEDEQHAHRAVVDARARAAEHRAAIQRIEALEGDLDGARAAEQQAAAHVARLEATVADAERQHEQRRRRRQARAEALDAVIDLTEVERVPTEVYLLARVAAQREVGQAGSLPLIVADATTGLSVDTTQGVLDVVERCSPVVQVVLMSDDPDIEEWARSFGAEGAAVRRFSFVPAAVE